MAIDTRGRRLTMLAMSSFPHSTVFFPDGTVGSIDRAWGVHLYGGITLQGAVALTIPIAAYHYNHHLGKS